MYETQWDEKRYLQTYISFGDIYQAAFLRIDHPSDWLKRLARALAPAPVGATGRTYILSIPPPRAPAAHAYGLGKARNGRT